MSSSPNRQSKSSDNVSQSVSNISETSEPLPDFIDVIRKGRLCEATAAMFAEYCSCSTIHGVRYLGERRRTWIEKIFWIIVFIISIYICCELIGDIWIKWNAIPVIVSFADKSTPIWKIPMPTFTICPDIKSNHTEFLFSNYDMWIRENASIIDQWTTQEKSLIDISLQICDYKEKNLFPFVENQYYGNMIQELTRIHPNVEEYVLHTAFERVVKNYTEYFDMVVTEFGICLSFNLMPLEMIYRKNVVTDELFLERTMDRTTKWTLEKGFEDDAKFENFPFRSYSSISETGMLAVLSGLRADIDQVCGDGDEGFKIAISTPGDIPQLSKQFFSVPFDYEVLVDITPDLTTTSSAAADFPWKFRQCFYESEKYLKFFNTYSESNCQLECLANYTLKKCGCVRFSMPRTKYTPVCGAGSISCYLEAKRDLSELDFRLLLDTKTETSDCNCLPSCTSIRYNVGVTQAPLNDLDNDMEKVTKFLWYFKENRFWSWERRKLYGIIEFTANAGGLLGLFMGISILSVVEIFYFMTVRLIGSLKIRYCSNSANRHVDKKCC